ncbi:MAG: methyltransferase domain-containing protein [Nitrospirae bacterium]|nr:methyltransferase domain-containing protein [Nitrospirota bacterium]
MNNQFTELIKTLEFPFCYYAYIIDRTGLIDYMHYGLWEDDTRQLKDAQENLASLMKSLIPDGVKRILDSGCGLGRTTCDLAAAGYSVIGISPDTKLMEMAKVKYGECKSQLVISSFEDYQSAELFDLILFQESAQYIKDIRFLFSHSKELLNKGGFILICDEIRRENSAGNSFHEKKEIESIAHEYGFGIRFNKDITLKVMKTRHIALKNIINHKDSLISEFSPIRGNARQEIESLIEGWKTHTAMFENNILGYEVFLFQGS